MKLIDMHCDTIGKLMEAGDRGDLLNTDTQIHIPGMKEAGTQAQFFASFGYLPDYIEKDGYDGCYEHILHMMECLKGQIKRHSGELALALSAGELARNSQEGRISAVLTVEEGGVINGRQERVLELYDKGVRLITLMWNFENCIGYPNSREASVMQKGLKPFGIEVVKQMGDIGMIVDVSHASDATVRDVLAYARGPVVASHSNCRALCSHPRNLPDELIRELANRGGVAGLNFYGAFLGTEKESKIEEMVAHVQHMIRVGGSEFPAIGTDFDGFDGMEHMDIPDVSHMDRLWQALHRSGISENQLDKIWSGNVKGVF